MKYALIPLISFILTQCAGSASSTYVSFRHDGVDREYLIFVPKDLPAHAPLLFVLHGYTDDAHQIRRYSNLDELASREGFVAVYPRGTIDKDNERFWNVGYDFHKGTEAEKIKDAEFLIALANHLQARFQLDPAQTFMTGMSNGAEMCYLMACRSDNVFEAFAPVAGIMLEKIRVQCSPPFPVSIFEIHGTKDEVSPYGGDLENNDGWGSYPPIESTISLWKERLSCDDLVEERIDGSATTRRKVDVYKHQSCDSGTEVWLYKVEGGTHEWPDGSDRKVIDASEEIWKFFEGRKALGTVEKK